MRVCVVYTLKVMEWWRTRSPWLLPALVAVFTAVLGIAVNVATDLRTNRVAWVVVVALVVAVGVGVALAERGRSAVPDAAGASRLVDEAAFAMAAREWPGNRANGTYMLEQLHRYLKAPVLVSRRHARRVLREAERRLQAADRKMDPTTVRRVLEPVLEVLPNESAYLGAIWRVPPELRRSALESGYNRLSAEKEDRWAWQYLLLLKDLCERTRC